MAGKEENEKKKNNQHQMKARKLTEKKGCIVRSRDIEQANRKEEEMKQKKK